MTEYMIGQYYTVPTVCGLMWTIEADWPVIGPLHEDAKLFDFPLLHYHVDWRFVNKQLYNRAQRECFIPLSHYPLHERDGKPLPPPVNKRLKCKRPFPKFADMAARERFATLEKEYAKCRLKAGLICPHRGISLGSLPAVDGVVQCPGHGLRWNIETGQLVRQCQEGGGDNG